MKKPQVMLEAPGALSSTRSALRELADALKGVEPDVQMAEPMRKSEAMTIALISISVQVGIEGLKAIVSVIREWRKKHPKEPEVVLYGPDNEKIDLNQ
jgi:hypothetical protein